METSTKNPKGGRPPKKATHRKTRHFSIRLTESEWKILKHKSQEEKIKAADLIRLHLLNQSPKRLIWQAIPPEYRNTLTNLEKLSGAVLYLSHKVSRDEIYAQKMRETALQISNIVAMSRAYLEQFVTINPTDHDREDSQNG